jgi:hypothetical protein
MLLYPRAKGENDGGDDDDDNNNDSDDDDDDDDNDNHPSLIPARSTVPVVLPFSCSRVHSDAVLHMHMTRSRAATVCNCSLQPS